MKSRKINDLPEAPYQKYASEAERRGIDITQGVISEPTAVILLGALDMIRELFERLEAVETGETMTKTEKLTNELLALNVPELRDLQAALLKQGFLVVVGVVPEGNAASDITPIAERSATVPCPRCGKLVEIVANLSLKA